MGEKNYFISDTILSYNFFLCNSKFIELYYAQSLPVLPINYLIKCDSV